MDKTENQGADYQLFYHRQKAGITQQQAADYLGVSRQTISKWEAGKSVPDGVYLKGICKLYHISADELLGIGEYENVNQVEASREEVVLDGSKEGQESEQVKASGKRKLKPIVLFLILDLLICIVLAFKNWKLFFWACYVNVDLFMIYGIYLVIRCLRKYLKSGNR